VNQLSILLNSNGENVVDYLYLKHSSNLYHKVKSQLGFYQNCIVLYPHRGQIAVENLFAKQKAPRKVCNKI